MQRAASDVLQRARKNDRRGVTSAWKLASQAHRQPTRLNQRDADEMSMRDGRQPATFCAGPDLTEMQGKIGFAPAAVSWLTRSRSAVPDGRL